MTKTLTTDKLKNVLVGIACSAVTLSILLGIYLIRYDFFVKGLRYYNDAHKPMYQEITFPELSRREIVNLGSAHRITARLPLSSYLHFPQEKPPGITRIGIFGCSFTRGSETESGHNFPTFLQEKFRQAGMHHVEVINFGVGGYGMHHSYLLWQTLGQKYDLDTVIFMFFDFHKRRDSSFIYSRTRYGPVRARYILKDDGLELVEVLGQSLFEASTLYFQFIPRWRYLRYDRMSPTLIRSLFPVGRKLRFNPFYYLPNVSLEDEMVETYRRIFENLSGEVKHLIVVTNDELGERLSEEAFAPNLYFLRSQVGRNTDNFLYEAPAGHLSALGNKMRGEELFYLLTGEERPVIDRVEIFERMEAREKRLENLPKPLSAYKDVSISIGEQSVSTFVVNPTNKLKENFTEELDFKKHNVESLLQISLKDGIFFPLPFVLEHQEPLLISFRAGKQTVEVPIGHVDSDLRVIGRISLTPMNPEGNLEKHGPDWSFKLIAEEGRVAWALFETARKIKDVKILLRDQVIFTGNPEGNHQFQLQPAQPFMGELTYLRSRRGQWFNPDQMDQPSGNLDLVLTRSKRKTERYPTYLQYTFTKVEPSSFHETYLHPILKIRGQVNPV